MKKMNQLDLRRCGIRSLSYVIGIGCVALLAACGGTSDAGYRLNVQVIGLNQQTIVLKNTLGTGHEDVLTVREGGLYRFLTPIPHNDSYSVTVADSANLSCVVTNDKGSNVTTTPPTVLVTCSGNDAASFSVGGRVSGLMTNQSFTVRVNPTGLPIQISQNGAYQFPTSLPSGGAYDVQIVSQAPGLFCSPVNGVGTINQANATVDIGCKTVRTEWHVSADVSGLAEGDVLALHNQQPGHADDVLLFNADNADKNQTFPQSVPDQGEYTLVIGPESQLNGRICSITSGNSTGRIHSNVTVQIHCSDVAPTDVPIAVKVTGLYDGNQLVVQNQTTTELMTLTSARTQDTFTQRVGIDQFYSVQITTLPTLQTCQISNGSGRASEANTVEISCGKPAIITVYSTPSPTDEARHYGYPVGLIKGDEGYFYGITTRINTLWTDAHRIYNHAGSVFKLDPGQPAALETIAGFQGSSCTGNSEVGGFGTGGVVPPSPTGLIEIQSGQLLGTTFGGGLPLLTSPHPQYSYECAAANLLTGNLLFRGTVFSYANNTFSQFLYQIGQDQATASQNAGPASGLIQDRAGNVYGITYGQVFAGTTAESTNQSVGTVFKWTKEGQWVPLYVFNADYSAHPVSGSSFWSGFYPSGKLMLDGNYLYGTTERGGTGDAGTVFRIDLTNNDPQKAFEVLYHFDSTGAPYVRPVVYDINTPADFFFVDPYASRYSGLTKGRDGHLYGVRRDGGANGSGAIYRLVANTSNGFTYELLYSFPNGKGTPVLELLDIDGIFYGTTLSDGDSGWGSLYRFNPETKSVVTIHSFQGDGQTPSTALMSGHDGKSIYGATLRGGAHDQGAIYKLTW